MMKRYLLILLCCIKIISADIGDVANVYNIKVLPPKFFDGVFTPSPRRGLLENIKRLNPKIIIEVGSYLGASAIYMGEHSAPDCKIYCVDIWEAPNEKWPVFDEVRAYFFQQFLSNIIHKKLQHKIIPIKMASLDAAKILDVKADLIYIDALHWEEDVYNDIMAWYPKLREENGKKQGVICGDDFMWTHPWAKGFPVKQAVERAAKELDVKIGTVGPDKWFWFFYT